MRKFKCISLKENPDVINEWSHAFALDNIYELSDEGFYDDLPVLIGEDGDKWVCDPTCFEEVFEEEIVEDELEVEYHGSGYSDTYQQGDKNILSISGTFGGVVFSFSGDFNNCWEILSFISSLEVEKK